MFASRIGSWFLGLLLVLWILTTAKGLELEACCADVGKPVDNASDSAITPAKGSLALAMNGWLVVFIGFMCAAGKLALLIILASKAAACSESDYHLLT